MHRSRDRSRSGSAGATLSLLDQALAAATPINFWNFQDLTKMWEDRSASPATPASVGNPVGTIQPTVGTVSLYAGTDAARGILTESGSYRYITFTAAIDIYQLVTTGTIVGTSISVTSDMTIMAAFDRASAGINSFILGNSGGATSAYAPWWFTDNIVYARIDASDRTIAASTVTGARVLTVRRSAAAGNSRNNGTQTSFAGMSAAASSFNRLGGHSAAFHNGNMYAVAVFDSELSGDALTKWEAYMASLNGAVMV